MTPTEQLLEIEKRNEKAKMAGSIIGLILASPLLLCVGLVIYAMFF